MSNVEKVSVDASHLYDPTSFFSTLVCFYKETYLFGHFVIIYKLDRFIKNIKDLKRKILTIVKVSVFIPEALELIGTLSPLDHR